MRNVKIFRANHGEGKTRWLVECIKECADKGFSCHYIGWKPSFNQVKSLYEAVYHEICPLKHGESYQATSNSCFFTDGYFDNRVPVFSNQLYIFENQCPWYITMDKEDFVN